MPVETFVAYGYDLGGPGAWRLHGFGPGDTLHTEWFDERNPLHDFADTAMTFLAGGVIGGKPDRALFNRIVAGMPFLIEETAHTGPADQPSPPRHVIVILDSVFGSDPDDYVGPAVDSDWDPLLNAALAELGLRSSDQQPKWMSYQSGSN